MSDDRKALASGLGHEAAIGRRLTSGIYDAVIGMACRGQ
jgi:hypothetical protein